ncbi:RidA family protein [Kaistia dalseonensis]|uniref:Enamine deaminase RidA (YjgF/YER057c/UK114 family) n=1 Tax=Kaistia dalseonensis TaxID=410840 RepID=A0ABU0H769_9HYPH|nr:RidA family protein [Kaistia dalseonensis]MCX5495038.1 RidA family protein [Kaistia dalseonensis]MDQ0437620.1 enamine deaminase RidA (YjgF/YER057c/UK114 family) [Kaistia dalseonensis]
MLIEQRLQSLGLVLPEVPTPVGTYLPYVQMGNLLFMCGQGPLLPDGTNALGKVGGDVTLEQGYERARITGLVMISVMKKALGDLDRVVRIGKILGMVNCVPEFGGHPQVINGCSDLFLEVFGEKGRHARSSVGMSSLPGNMTVEIEAVVEVAP